MMSTTRRGNFHKHGRRYRNRRGYLLLLISSIICRPSKVRATATTSNELTFISSSPSTRGQQIKRTQRIRGKSDNTIRRTRRGMESLPAAAAYRDIGEEIFPEWIFAHLNENENSKYKQHQQQSKESPKVDKKFSSFGRKKKGITATEIEDDSGGSDGDDVDLSAINNNELDNTMSDSNDIYSSAEDDNEIQTEETLSPPKHNNDNDTAKVGHPNRLPSITTTTTSTPGPVTVPTPSSTSTTKIDTETDVETITSPEQSQLQPQLSPTPSPIVTDSNINDYSLNDGAELSGTAIPSMRPITSSSDNASPTSANITALPNTVNNTGIIDKSSTDLVCTAVESQQQPSLLSNNRTTGTTTTVFSVGVSVTYYTDVPTESDIETYLDVVNIPITLWIAGCAEKAKTMGYHLQQLAIEEDVTMAVAKNMDADPSVRRRSLHVQEKEGDIIPFPSSLSTTTPPIVTYSEMEFWENASPCDTVGDNLSTKSSSFLCQQKFASRVRIVTIGDSTENDYLRNQIIDAFDIFLKPLVWDRTDVIAVELLDDKIRVANDEKEEAAAKEEIVQLEIDESNSNTNGTENDWLEQRRVTIISYSVIVAGFVMGTLLFVLIFIYQRRQKRWPILSSSYVSTRQAGSRHVPFEDESGINIILHDDNNDNDNNSNNNSSNMKSSNTANIESGKYAHENEKELAMSVVYPHLIHKGNSDTSSDDGDDDDEDDNCFNDPDLNIVTFEGGRPSEEIVFLANDTELFRLNHPVNNAYKDEEGFHICSAATCVACEQRRRLGIVNPSKPPVFISVKGSSARTPTTAISPRTWTPIIRSPSTVTGPRIERTPWTAEAYTRPEAYTRQYALDDVVEL